MTNTADPKVRGHSRVFIIENRAGPTHAPEYLDFGAAGAFEQNFGDSTRIEVPSPTQYNQFEVVGEISGAVENATLPIMYQSKLALSRLFELARRRCAYDVQVHIGQCNDPRDFDTGWQVILVLEQARSTTYSTDDLGALTSSDQEKVTEETETSALRAYEIVPMAFAKRVEASVTSAIVAVEVCDKPDCGECGASSNGCQIVLSVSDPAGSSPGHLPEVIYTTDGYTNGATRTITTFAVGDNPDDAACVGTNFVVVSADSESLHVADTSDITSAAETWQEVTTGFVAGKGPRAITSFSPRDTWIVGNGGYIYFTSNPFDGVTVQDAGVATTQALQAVDSFSDKLVVAVGDSNAVVFTENGGDSWSLVVGPAVGINLVSVGIRAESEWWVGTANGKVYYTLNKGISWTEKSFTGSGTGSVDDIVWASDTVGFIAHNSGTVGRILRSISGGNTWYRLPELASNTMPTVLSFASLAVCQQEVNVVYAGGKATGGVDGVIVKGSP